MYGERGERLTYWRGVIDFAIFYYKDKRGVGRRARRLGVLVSCAKRNVRGGPLVSADLSGREGGSSGYRWRREGRVFDEPFSFLLSIFGDCG